MFWLTPEGDPVRYWDLPELQIANNSRVASASINFAIAKKYPVKGIREPTKDVYLMVREPIDRFISAVARVQVQYPGEFEDIDGLISNFPIDEQYGNHWGSQCQLLSQLSKTFLFRYPDHLYQFSKCVGLDIPWANRSTWGKITLTDSQKSQLVNRYREDVELFESIKRPGLIYA